MKLSWNADNSWMFRPKFAALSPAMDLDLVFGWSCFDFLMAKSGAGNAPNRPFHEALFIPRQRISPLADRQRKQGACR
jgi:hypothetical protein